MSFDRERAQLTDEQLDFAEAVDTIVEHADDVLADGFQITDLISAPALAGSVMTVVQSLATAGGVAGVIPLAVGGTAAILNDNPGLLAGASEDTAAESE